MTLASPPLRGLVLAGGRSARMQRDKAALQYHPGRTQVDVAMDLLAVRTQQVFLSVRADQAREETRARYPQILDHDGVEGPIAGILAAFAQSPQSAWLVLACDLPFLDGATLDRLIDSRAVSADATAFRSSHDGLPEPLCAIYEPRAAAGIAAQVAAGKLCPRKFLLNANTHLLQPVNPRALDNVNTQHEYASALSALAAPEPQSPEQELKVRYYALLREQAGRSEERLMTRARTPQELYAELAARYPFTLPAHLLRVAVNSEFGDWTQVLRSGDEVVFIPPVAGG